MPPALVFCDLDGTLVLDNSFHIFLARFWAEGWLPQRWALLKALLPRAFGRFSGGHAGMKRRALLAFSLQDSDWRSMVIASTLAGLTTTRSEPIERALLHWRAQGARIVLATAAPELYARPLADAMGVECFASPAEVGSDWQELLAERKAEACRHQIEATPGAHVVVLTDHPDDLPLLSMADTAVLQASAAGFARISAALNARAATCRLEHVDPTAPQEGGGQWLWLDDRPHGPLDLWETRTILSKHRHALLYIGGGKWRRVGPGQSLADAALRRECPLPPSSKHRLVAYLRRRLMRDWLGIFH